ncbi:uncharacterized protein CDAR_65671 [Caerostris darwini]|uniref:Uncharacterized protein n=1 Tax=Caerostris darwini TaxID=1538125 RepID=A0AAV4UC35_9ARAC|nr:uncharacterized protein CDAR_65671 [Caerostris darwini]
MKRFRRRMSHSFQSQSSDNGLSDLAESLSIQENGDINKREQQRLGLLGRATRRLSFSTSRIMDIHSNNSSVPDGAPRHSVSLHFRDLMRSRKKRRNSVSLVKFALDFFILENDPHFLPIQNGVSNAYTWKRNLGSRQYFSSVLTLLNSISTSTPNHDRLLDKGPSRSLSSGIR